MEFQEWARCQEDATSIVASGWRALCEFPVCEEMRTAVERACVYLVELDGQPCYIGEAKSGRARLRQQFTTKTSTFYSTYADRSARDGSVSRPIGDFKARCMPVAIGRKELEEYGIVSMERPLNKFQLGKRELYRRKVDLRRWIDLQRQHEELIDAGISAALMAPTQAWLEARPPSVAGLYLVWREGKLLYIGESASIAERLRSHSGRTYFSALRRNVGEDCLGFTLQVIKGKKRYFTDDEDRRVTEFLAGCEVGFLPVAFGRFETEERLVARQLPRLNRKGAIAREAA